MKGLKYVNYAIVTREIPGEITLAINLSRCPNHCPGCHSDYLAGDIGEVLDRDTLYELIDKNPGITCVAFMGGDNDPHEVMRLAFSVKAKDKEMKTAWYSGKDYLIMSANFIESYMYFDYIKFGRWDASRGPLNDPRTNQVMLKLEMINGDYVATNITEKFIDNYE